MSEPTDEVARLLQRLRSGDMEAKDLLIAHARKQFLRLTSRMLRNYPALRRWQETDDVMQQALIRLDKALKAKAPVSSEHFINLATRSIRQELYSLARHHLGPQGHAAKHHSDRIRKAGDGGEGPLGRSIAAVDEPETLEGWSIFHQAVESLPEEVRQVAELIWYGDFSQEQVADELGLSIRTVKRRWQSARLSLAETLRNSGVNR